MGIFDDEEDSTKCPADHSKGFCDFGKKTSSVLEPPDTDIGGRNMGIFDDVETTDEMSLTCAAGHQLNNWQTKDLHEGMLQYLLKNNKLWIHARKDGSWGPDPASLCPANAESITWNQKEYLNTFFDGIVHIYNPCEQCEMVPDIVDRWTNKHYPWVEYQLRFSDGILDRCRIVEQETVDQVKAKVLERQLQRSEIKENEIIS